MAGILSVMHDFNSVSGMWSEMWLKGKGGRRGGEGTNIVGNKDRKRGGRSVRRKEEEEGVAFLHILSRTDSGWTRASGEGRKVEGGGEERDGGEGPEWLLSASHVSKPVLKNE